MKILVVEDRAANILLYKRAAAALNKRGYGLKISDFNNLKDALRALKEKDFDGAIIDLKLSAGTDEAEGNQIIKEIVDIKRFPVFVYSSFPEEIDAAIPESAFFKKFRRTDITLLALLTELKRIYDTGITKILGKDGFIEDYLTKIFWENIAGSFDFFKDNEVPRDQLLRYIAGHIYEHLELGGDGSFTDYYPEEVYIIPSIKKSHFTGSILEDKTTKKYYIILTPPCDIAQGKTASVIIAKIDSFEEYPVGSWLGIFKKKMPSGGAGRILKKKKKEILAKLERLIRNNYAQMYYFLPQSERFKGGLINFRELQTIKVSDLNRLYNLKAAINSQFLKDIIARFSFYYSRQGAPDLNLSLDDFMSRL